MRKVVALIVALTIASPVFGHVDTLLPIAADGTLQRIPAEWGPVKLSLRFSPSGPNPVSEVVITSPRFKAQLNQCILRLIQTPSIRHVRASGSWYHDDLDRLPPYVSLDFYSESYDPSELNNDVVTVVISLRDGSIVMGFRHWDRWWAPARSKRIEVPSSCASWAHGHSPNSSFKSKLLRSST